MFAWYKGRAARGEIELNSGDRFVTGSIPRSITSICPCLCDLGGLRLQATIRVSDSTDDHDHDSFLGDEIDSCPSFRSQRRGKDPFITHQSNRMADKSVLFRRQLLHRLSLEWRQVSSVGDGAFKNT